MVSIDTVYQRVLALANKEQRGYITPQEFNLFANQAQLEIVDQYFNDINQFGRMPKNDTEYSDMVAVINEKLGVLKIHDISISLIAGVGALPLDLYKLGDVYSSTGAISTQVNQNELSKLKLSPLTNPSSTRSVYILQASSSASSSNGDIRVDPMASLINISYVKKPNSVRWGYVVISDKALYDPTPNKTTNFELHAAEETELVYKILKLSGAAIQRQDIAQFAQGMEQALEQKEKQ